MERSRAVVETDMSETKSETKMETKTDLGLNFGLETVTGKVRDQWQDRKNDVIIGFFDLKKAFGVLICSLVVLWLYKLIQMTNCLSLGDYFLKTFQRRHFMQIFTKVILKECLQLNLMPLTQRSKHDHLYFLQELPIFRGISVFGRYFGLNFWA